MIEIVPEEDKLPESPCKTGVLQDGLECATMVLALAFVLIFCKWAIAEGILASVAFFVFAITVFMTLADVCWHIECCCYGSDLFGESAKAEKDGKTVLPKRYRTSPENYKDEPEVTEIRLDTTMSRADKFVKVHKLTFRRHFDNTFWFLCGMCALSAMFCIFIRVGIF